VILVWGFKSYVRLLGVLTLVCGNCQNPAAQRVVEQVRKFTLFWIPLFPVKRQTLMTCTYCGVATALTKEQAEQLAGHLAAPGMPPTAPGGPTGQALGGGAAGATSTLPTTQD